MLEARIKIVSILYNALPSNIFVHNLLLCIGTKTFSSTFVFDESIKRI